MCPRCGHKLPYRTRLRLIGFLQTPLRLLQPERETVTCPHCGGRLRARNIARNILLVITTFLIFGIGWKPLTRVKAQVAQLGIPGLSDTVPFLFVLSVLAITFLYLPRIKLEYLPANCCAKCEYDLAGLTADKCPECGQPTNAE